MAQSVCHTSLLNDIQQATRVDEELQQLIARYKTESVPRYTTIDGLLFQNDRMVIPSTAKSIQNIILHESHASPIGGHSDIARTYAQVASQFFWPHMRADVKTFVTQCMICQQAKHSHLLPAGLLQPLPIPTQIWDDMAMDFIVGLPPSNGFTVILVVIDRLSKYAHFLPLKSSFTSQQVAEKFFEGVVKLHGLPASIVSNRDRVFTSSFWKQLFKLQGTTLRMSSSYHPQSDGQSEALNKCLKCICNVMYLIILNNG